jgi:hypothetical protein
MDTLKDILSFYKKGVVERLDIFERASSFRSVVEEEYLRRKTSKGTVQKALDEWLETQPTFAGYAEAEKDFEKLVECLFEEV